MMNKKIKIYIQLILPSSYINKKGIGKNFCFNESHVEIWIIHRELMVFHN